MKIYTRTGDDGTTALFGGQRVGKDDLRVEAYGTVDELNSAIGLARSLQPPAELDAVLGQLQDDLFVMGAEMACVPGAESKLRMKLIDAGDSEKLERLIDAAEQGLPPLRAFVLPCGTPAASALHVARTVARRAERLLIRAQRQTTVRGELLVYLNRLSDLLFTLARRANHLAGMPDVEWKPARDSQR